MSTDINFKVMELLASKICHDLISPIGAVNNGMELMEELGPDAGQEASALIAYSAQQASAKLQAYRMAYGVGGADTSIKPEDVYNAIDALISAEGKVKQEWDPHAPLGPEERPGAFCKILISAFLLAMECLPKGGVIRIENGEGGSFTLSAEGEDADIRNEAESCLNLSMAVENLEPKHAHAYVMGLNVKHYNYNVSIEKAGENTIRFLVNSPANQ